LLTWFHSSRTRGEVSRELGWKPQKTKEDFKAAIEEEFRIILDQQKQNPALKANGH
jgi:hypothetical protein